MGYTLYNIGMQPKPQRLSNGQAVIEGIHHDFTGFDPEGSRDNCVYP